MLYGLYWSCIPPSTCCSYFIMLQGTQFDDPRPSARGVLFFSQPTAGLTNWMPVRDSRAGTPLYFPRLEFAGRNHVSEKTCDRHISLCVWHRPAIFLIPRRVKNNASEGGSGLGFGTGLGRPNCRDVLGNIQVKCCIALVTICRISRDMDICPLFWIN